MLFNSAIFLLLFFVVYSLYWHLSVRGKHYLIIVASFIFYGWFSIPFLLLFLFLIIFNYYISRILLVRKSKGLLALAVIVDVGVLAFFKYFYLFAESFGYLIGNEYIADLRVHWQRDHNLVIILPIAISFYTFQIIAWVVDCYRGTVQEDSGFRRFCVFILFFPQFVAGPIMRASDFLPQIDNPTPSQDRMLNGCLLLAQGAVKKVLIADRIGAAIGPVWASPSEYDAVVLVLIMPAFLAQVFCDFSGYTDMARGLAKLLGYEIPENFNGPYLARTVTELWQRWHITLSMWLRDYVYIPLGGSRRGEFMTYANLFFTMTLAGLWHGANWTMGLWGLLMGFYLVIERFVRVNQFLLLPDTLWARVIQNVRTVVLFATSTILFASPSIENSASIVKGIASWQRAAPLASAESVIGLTLLGFLFNIPQYYRGIHNWFTPRVRLRYVLVFVLTFVVGYLINLYGDVSGSFIYFAF